MKKKKFKIDIEQDEEGYFVGNIPHIQACHTQGKTLPQLLRRLAELIELNNKD